MNHGTIKYWNLNRGFGFIVPEDGGADVFVHVRNLANPGLDGLDVGERVSFEVAPDGRNGGKVEAKNVRVIQ